MGHPPQTEPPHKIAEHELVESPAWFPLEVIASPASMRLLHLDETGYRKASFLDQRLLAGPHRQATCSLETLWAAAAKLRPRAHYIFHTGHVGSTLISRLIGAHGRLFSVREPALLRTFVGAGPAVSAGPAAGASPAPGASPAASASATAGASPAPHRLEQLQRVLSLFSRTWRSEQRAVIKATSTVSELAESILGGDDHPAAIFMFAQPLAYLRGILGGPNSRVEAKAMAPARLQRLLNRLEPGNWQFDPRSEGELIAMNWLCEMVTLHQAARRFPRQVLWVDFDAFLAAPAAGLQVIFQTLGETVPALEIEKLVTGPLMRQYSKAPEHAYDAALRQEVLRAADWEHSQAIKQGMEWLGKVTSHYPLAANIRAS
jgi:hypothetical protein